MAWPGMVIKQYQKNHVCGVIYRLVTGIPEQRKALLPAHQVLYTATLSG